MLAGAGQLGLQQAGKYERRNTRVEAWLITPMAPCSWRPGAAVLARRWMDVGPLWIASSHPGRVECREGTGTRAAENTRLRDLQATLSVFSEDVVHVVHLPQEVALFVGEVRGKEQLAKQLEAILDDFDFIEYVPLQITAEGANLHSQVRFHDRHKATGLDLDSTMRHVWRVEATRLCASRNSTTPSACVRSSRWWCRCAASGERSRYGLGDVGCRTIGRGGKILQSQDMRHRKHAKVAIEER